MVDHEPAGMARQDTLVARAGGHFYGWVVVAAATLLLFTSHGITYSFGAFFKSLQAEFDWSRATTSSLFSLYLLLTGAFAVAGGWAADRYGPRKVILLMGAVTGLSLVLTSRVNAAWQLYLTYSLLLALGLGPMYIILMATASRWFVAKRATAIAIIGTGAGLGTIVFAPLSAWIIHSHDWRTAYLLSGIVAWATILPAAALLKRDPVEIDVQPDGARAADGPAAFNGDHYAQGSAWRLLQTRPFWHLFLAWFCYAFCLFLVMGHLVVRGEDAGMSPVTAAALLSLMQVVAIPSRLAGGLLADRYGKKTVAVVAAVVMASAMLWVAAAVGGWMVVAFALAFGLGYGVIDPPVVALAADVFGVARVGQIMGILMIGWASGSAAGPYLGGLVFDLTGGYAYAFALAALAMIFSALAVSRLQPPLSQRRPLPRPQTGSQG